MHSTISFNDSGINYHGINDLTAAVISPHLVVCPCLKEVSCVALGDLGKIDSSDLIKCYRFV